MTLTLATVVGLAGAVLAFVGTVPQAMRLRRTGSAAGVSVTALANSTVSGLAWTAYGVALADAWVVLPALLTLPATVAALVLAWSRGGSRDRLWLPAVWAGALLAAAASTLWLGGGLFTAVLGCSVAFLVTPAAVTAWRSVDVSALAASTWVMLLVDALVAGLYGVLAGVDANLVYAAVAGLGSLAVLVRVALPAHLHARLVAPATALDPLVDGLSRESLELAS